MGLPPRLADWHAPFDFLNVSRFPHKNPSIYARSIPNFRGHDDSVILHISSFMEFNLSMGIIHEDVMMNFFCI
jgi:hypothetical protein